MTQQLAVLVPRRSEPWRDRLWGVVRSWWLEQLQPSGLVEGFDEGPGPMNRSAAINRAADLAGAWDVAIIADADTIPNRPVLLDACSLAASSGTLVVPHDEFHSLNKATTETILELGWGSMPLPSTAARYTKHNTKSSCIVVPRALWEEVRGFDPGFVGWGFEDAAFYAACSALGGVARLPGPVWHLWHPRSLEKNPDLAGYEANRQRAARYKERRGAPLRMRALIKELRG